MTDRTGNDAYIHASDSDYDFGWVVTVTDAKNDPLEAGVADREANLESSVLLGSTKQKRSTSVLGKLF